MLLWTGFCEELEITAENEEEYVETLPGYIGSEPFKGSNSWSQLVGDDPEVCFMVKGDEVRLVEIGFFAQYTESVTITPYMDESPILGEVRKTLLSHKGSTKVVISLIPSSC